MSPQPLHKMENITFSSHEDILQRCPRQAALMMRVINIWSQIDYELSAILCEMMKTDLRIGVAAFGQIRNPDAREEILQEAATIALRKDREGMDLLTKTLRRIRATRKERNRFAHSLVGIAHGGEEGAIVLIDPGYWAKQDAYTREIGKVEKQTGAIDWSDYEGILFKKEPMLYYTLGDLEKAVHDATNAFIAVTHLRYSLDRENKDCEIFRAELRGQLFPQGSA